MLVPNTISNKKKKKSQDFLEKWLIAELEFEVRITR
jgi:hypothetical protein